MGEPNCGNNESWKKLVLAKANDEWISTIKTEHIDVDSSGEVPEYEDGECDTSGSSPPPINFVNVHNLPPLEITDQKRRRKGQSPRSETPDERAMRLAKMSAYAAHRLANESPDQRAARLKRMSEYAAKRLATETSEQRERRLARMSAYAARRLAEESPEQRAARLARMSAYAARRHAMKKIMLPMQMENGDTSATNNICSTQLSQQNSNSVTNQS